MHELLAFTINHTNDFVNAKRHARARETSARRVGVSGLLTEKVDSTIHVIKPVPRITRLVFLHQLDSDLSTGKYSPPFQQPRGSTNVSLHRKLSK